jgi:ribosomal protein S18 acetylase RimI-like enzyme
MLPAAFEAWLAESIHGYADDKARAGIWSAERALELSQKEFATLLPAGLKTPENHLFSIFDAEHVVPVGMIWFAEVARATHREAFIYDFHIDERFRGKGHGAAALAALETEVLRHGLTRISLHTFGDNPAQRLYQRCGFRVTSLNMTKLLSPH